MPAPEDMLMMEPPPTVLIIGMACLEPKKAPLTLMSMIRVHSASLVSSTVPRADIPALLTRISSLPKRVVTSLAACVQSASLVTSSRTKKHSPPAAVTSAAVLRPSSSRMSPMTSLAPSRAKILVMAAPMPLAPPLIKATLFSSRI